MKSSRSPRSAGAILQVGAWLLLSGASAWAANPSPDVKRLLFPAEAALASDSLDLAEREALKALALDPNVTVTHLLLAESAWRRGQPAKAKAEYEKAAQLGDANAEAQAGLSLVALSQDDLQSAEKTAAAAVAADKGSWLANYAMGRVLVAKGNHDEAFKHFKKGKSLKGRADRRDLFEAGMGLVALAENDAPGAETSFIKARAMSPNTVEHTMNLAAMYEVTNQWSQAANVLLAAEQKVGGSPQLSFRVGRCYEHQQQWNDALRQYQKALQADSTYAPALAALGHLYLLDKSKTPLAVEVLSRAVKLRPTPATRIDLGAALVRANRPAEAVPYLEAAVQEEASIEAKVALARAYVAAEQLDKAMPLYEDIDVALEAPAVDLLQAGNAASKAKDYERAKLLLNRALEKDPQLSDAYYRLGVVELMSKNYEAAVQHFVKKTEMDPKSAMAYVNMGIAYQGLGRLPDALTAYRQATHQAPNSVQAWVTLGQALSSADSALAAQKAYARAVALDPQNAAAKRGLGFTYLVLEKYPDAIKYLKEAVQAESEDPQGWVWLGQAQLNAGNHPEARNSFQRALKLEPGNKPAQEGLSLINGAASPR